MKKIFYKRNKLDEKIILVIFILVFLSTLVLGKGLSDATLNSLGCALVYAIFANAIRNMKWIWNKGLDMPPKKIKDEEDN